MRRGVKHKPNADVYEFKRECLAEFERLSEQGHIDLFYGDESGVSLLPCVPYAWQFQGEQVVMPSERGGNVNCFALISRDNRLHRHLTSETITAAWLSERLDALSLSLPRLTVVVLDNASVHKKAVRERGAVWQERGLFVFFLPPYCPHLNIAEILWRKLKYDKNQVRVAVSRRLCGQRDAASRGLASIGSSRSVAKHSVPAVPDGQNSTRKWFKLILNNYLRRITSYDGLVMSSLSVFTERT